MKHAKELFGVEQMVRTHAAAATGVGNEAVKAAERVDVVCNECSNIGFNSYVCDLMTDLA